MALPGFEFIDVPSPIDLGMPKKFGDWRKDQFETVRSVALSEKPAFLLDAPPGIGKTVIAIGSYHLMHERYKKLEAVRVVLDEKEKKRFRCIFVTPTKQLQRQLTDEFPYCKTLVGRNNFPCLLRKDSWPEVTAEDCTNSKDQPCPHASGILDHGPEGPRLPDRWEKVDICPYQEAKRQAMASPVATLNTSYFLSEANGPGLFSHIDVLVVDEIDTLESDLMNFVELTVSECQMRRYGIELPMTKGMGGLLFNQQFLAVWQAWAGAQVIELGLRSDAMSGDIAQAKLWTDIEIRQSKEIRQAKRLQGKLNLFAAEVTDDWVFYENQTEDGSTWTFKPAVVGDLAGKYVWRHVEDMALGMSGTILDPKRVAEDIGLGDWDYLQMPCPFPVERRPVYYKPVANLTNATMEYELPKLGREIDRIMREDAPDHKILVHTVSYRIRDYLMNFLSQKDRLMTHGSKDRADMLDEFKESVEPLVMVSPSFDRGVDLPNVYQIVCKMPYMNLGDLQVQKRMSMPGGQQWYLLKAAQTIVQMTGRGMRASDNFCKSWILDKQFMNLMSRVGTMIPDWWKKAIVRQAIRKD